jgi:hypothetical protein
MLRAALLALTVAVFGSATVAGEGSSAHTPRPARAAAVVKARLARAWPPAKARPAVEPRPAVKMVRPRVTFIGDSVADAVSYVTSAQTLLARGVRLQLELAECRRLVEASCSVAGVQPETALDLIDSLGKNLGPVVVIAVGYNDYERLYPRDMQQVLAALHAAGVQHVLWLTLRAVHASYVPMNADIRALARTNPCLTVVDWNRYSRSHPTWFAGDGLHLSPAGAAAMARLLHKTLLTLTTG